MFWIGLLIALLILFLCLGIGAVNGDADLGHMCFIIDIAILIVLIFVLFDYHGSYKQGQIDALNGEFKYKQVIEESVDTTYIEIDK